MSEYFSECSRCGKPIYYGNAYVSIVRNIEQADFELTINQPEITVIDSNEIIVFCGSCGNSFNTDTIAKIIKAIPTEQNGISEN